MHMHMHMHMHMYMCMCMCMHMLHVHVHVHVHVQHVHVQPRYLTLSWPPAIHPCPAVYHPRSLSSASACLARTVRAATAH